MTILNRTIPNIVIAIVALAALAVVGWGGCQLNGWRADRAAKRAAAARDVAAGKTFEAQGTAAIAGAADEARRQLEEQRTANAKLDQEARQDPAGATALPDSVRERIARGDRELCGRTTCR